LIDPARRFVFRDLLNLLLVDKSIVGYNQSRKNANFVLLVATQVKQFPTPIMPEEELLFHFLEAYRRLRGANASLEVIERLYDIGCTNYSQMLYYRKTALYSCSKYDEFISLFNEDDVKASFQNRYLKALTRRKENMEDALAFIQRYPDNSHFICFEAAIICYDLQEEFSSRLKSLRDDFSSGAIVSASTDSSYQVELFWAYSTLRRNDLCQSIFEKLRQATDLEPGVINGISIYPYRLGIYSKMMTIYFHMSQPALALMLFHEIKSFGFPLRDQTYFAAINACRINRSHRLLRNIYGEMRDNGLPVNANICAIIVKSVITAATPNWFGETMRIFWGMIEIEGVAPNERIVRAILEAHSLRDERGMLRIFERNVYGLEQSHSCYNMISNMYAKQLNVDEYVGFFNG
jgi:hypothetical protein